MRITAHTYHPTAVRSLFTVHRSLAENYSFSAKERDVETGLSYFGARYYSSDLSIWLSVDPMSDKYPSLSPYVYCADNPVKLVDPEGEEIWIFFEETLPDGEKQQYQVQYCFNELYNDDGSLYEGNNEYAIAVRDDLNFLKESNPQIKDMICTLENSDCIHTISNTAENGFEEFYFNKTSIENMQDAYERTPTNTSVKYNPFNEKTLNGEIRPPFIGLCHELLGHSYDADQGRFDHTKSLTGIPMYEVNACNVENVVRKYCGVNIRTTYAGKTLP